MAGPKSPEGENVNPEAAQKTHVTEAPRPRPRGTPLRTLQARVRTPPHDPYTQCTTETGVVMVAPVVVKPLLPVSVNHNNAEALHIGSNIGDENAPANHNTVGEDVPFNEGIDEGALPNRDDEDALLPDLDIGDGALDALPCVPPPPLEDDDAVGERFFVAGDYYYKGYGHPLHHDDGNNENESNGLGDDNNDAQSEPNAKSDGESDGESDSESDGESDGEGRPSDGGYDSDASDASDNSSENDDDDDKGREAAAWMYNTSVYLASGKMPQSVRIGIPDEVVAEALEIARMCTSPEDAIEKMYKHMVAEAKKKASHSGTRLLDGTYEKRLMYCTAILLANYACPGKPAYTIGRELFKLGTLPNSVRKVVTYDLMLREAKARLNSGDMPPDERDMYVGWCEELKASRKAFTYSLNAVKTEFKNLVRTGAKNALKKMSSKNRAWVEEKWDDRYIDTLCDNVITLTGTTLDGDGDGDGDEINLAAFVALTFRFLQKNAARRWVSDQKQMIMRMDAQDPECGNGAGGSNTGEGGNADSGQAPPKYKRKSKRTCRARSPAVVPRAPYRSSPRLHKKRKSLGGGAPPQKRADHG